MWQAQEKDFEREGCRKEREPVLFFLGHTVKNCMTVIVSMGSYQREKQLRLTLYDIV
jgi:hypothetical protein